MGCAFEAKVCVDFELTACDEITIPTDKKECKKNGCVFNKDDEACEVDPLDLCITTCGDPNLPPWVDINICCAMECKCSNYDKGGKCKKESNCAFNKETKVCALKSAEDTPKDKCSKLNKKKCNGKKGVKKGCVYNDGSCVGCAVNNGNGFACVVEVCSYNKCTGQCSKSKE